MREKCGSKAGENALENAREVRWKMRWKMRGKMREKCARNARENAGVFYGRTLQSMISDFQTDNFLFLRGDLTAISKKQ